MSLPVENHRIDFNISTSEDLKGTVLQPDTESTEQEPHSLSFAPTRTDIIQVGRGMLMGGADIIPGVSGGTVALILGIYERLVTAISRFDPTFLGYLAKREFQAAGKHVDIRFLGFLGIGIATGVIVLGAVMHTLLEDYRQLTMAAFFGMIGASCVLVAKLVDRWRWLEMLLLITGAGFALWLVTRPTFDNPPDALWYIFLCGTIGICAMILPGISGAFILLILGKYHEITGIIKEVLKLQLSLHSLAVVATFGCGCLCGLISFSKCLKWLLAHFKSPTMSVLCGFMLGSLYKIWPFQFDSTPGVHEFKHKIFKPIPFNEMEFGLLFWGTVLTTIIAAVLVLLLEWIGNPERKLKRLENASR